MSSVQYHYVIFDPEQGYLAWNYTNTEFFGMYRWENNRNSSSIVFMNYHKDAIRLLENDSFFVYNRDGKNRMLKHTERCIILKVRLRNSFDIIKRCI